MRRFAFPPKPAVTRALLLAPLLPALILFLIEATFRALQYGPLAITGAALLALYTLIVMEICVVVVGGIILAIIWERIAFHILIFIMLGGLVASLPLLGLLAMPQTDYDAWYNGRSTVIDGEKTSFGYWRDVLALGQIFVFGAIGGGFFWWLCRPSKYSKEA